MVKRQRRMTVKKNSKKSGGRAPRAKAHGKSPAKTTKGKTRPAAKGSRAKSQTDRANTAFKALMKAMQNQSEDLE
jgi:hypothetical protein